MPKLRSLVLMLAFCAFTSAASADDFWMAPLGGYGAPLYAAPSYVAPVAPAYVAPTYFAPAVVVPRVAIPTVVVPAPVPAHGFPAYFIPTLPSYDYAWDDYGYDDVWREPPCDDFTDLMLLNRLESIDQTLQSIEYEVREARHQQDWDRILGTYRH